MAVHTVGSTTTPRHPSSYNLGIHRHPASAGLDRPHGGAAACIRTGASAAGNIEAGQVNTEARVERGPPRHADGGTAAKHFPARCHRCGFCSAGTQAQRSPTPSHLVPVWPVASVPPAPARSRAKHGRHRHSSTSPVPNRYTQTPTPGPAPHGVTLARRPGHGSTAPPSRPDMGPCK